MPMMASEKQRRRTVLIRQLCPKPEDIKDEALWLVRQKRPELHRMDVGYVAYHAFKAYCKETAELFWSKGKQVHALYFRTRMSHFIDEQLKGY